MRKILAVATMMVAGSASGQTSWSTNRFTVSTDNMTSVSIVDGTVEIQELPFGISNPGSNLNFPPGLFHLEFTAKPGYELAGELVSFAVDTSVDAYDAPTNLSVKALGGFTVDISGEYSQSDTNDGGIAHYSGSHFLTGSNLVAEADVFATEGIACPIGDEGNGCNFGLDWVFLGASVEFSSFSVTPLLSPVSEPDMGALCLASLGLCAAMRMAGHRTGRPCSRSLPA